MQDYGINEKWIDKYLHTNYIGYVKGRYECGCHLYLKDINNFIVNAGLYADLEIMRMDGELLLNTCGVFLNHMLPDHLADTIEGMQMNNYIASVLQAKNNEQGYDIPPLAKVSKFINEAINQGIISSREDMKFDTGDVQESTHNLSMT